MEDWIFVQLERILGLGRLLRARREAAEQIYSACDGDVKKAYVLNYLAEKGIRFDAETVERMIEASVLMLHNELYGVEKKGANA